MDRDSSCMSRSNPNLILISRVVLASDLLHVLLVVLDEWHWMATSEIELINATSCICGMMEILNQFRLTLFLQPVY